MSMSASQTRNRDQARRRLSHAPPGTESNPRFAPSPDDLGAASAQQILDEFRKQLEGVDLKAEAPKKRARKKN